MSGVTSTGSPTITVTLSQLQGIDTDKLQFAKTEDKQLFLELVNNAYADKAGSDVELEIPRPLNAGELGLVPRDRDRYDSVLGNAFDVLMVLRKLGAEMEHSSREAKHAAREGEHLTMLASADKIRAAAAAEFVCSMVAGAIQIAGGALAVRGSLKAMDVGLKPYNIGAPKPTVPAATATGTTPTTPGATPAATSTPGTWQKATNPSIASQADGPAAPPRSPPPKVQIGNERSAPRLEAAPKQVAKPDGPLKADPVTTDGLTPAPKQGAQPSGPLQAEATTTPTWQKGTPSRLTRSDDGVKAGSHRAEPTPDAPEITPQQRMAIDKANIEAQGIQGKWNAVLQIGMGASSMVNSIGQLGSKMMEADKVELDAEAKQWGYKVDDAKESQDTFHQLKEEMQKIMSELNQSEYQINQQIWG